MAVGAGLSPPRARALAPTLVLLLGLGCGVDPGPQLPELPAEKTAADFPGLRYPAHLGDIPRPGGRGGPVWLVGIDGATWDLASPLLAAGRLPHLERLVREGAHGPLLSEEPMVSPALWTTIATGVPRFAHGITDFTVKLPSSYNVAGSGPPDRRWPALWELVGAAGGSSAVVSWCGSFPAEEIPGCYLSEALDLEQPDPRRVHPPSLVERLQGLELGADEDASRRIGRSDYLSRTLRRDLVTMALVRLTARQCPADLVAVYLSGIDVVQHVTWRHMDPASQQFPQDGAPDPQLAEVIPDYYRAVDRMVGEMVDLAPPGTTFVIVSDHGAGPIQPAEAFHLRLEVLLEAMGLVNGSAGPLFTIDQLYRHDKLVWLNLEGVEPNGVVPLARAEAEAAAAAGRLRRLMTDDGRPLFALVAEHVTEPGWQPGDPALTVRFAIHTLLTAQVHEPDRSYDFARVRVRHSDVSGAHRPEGMVILHGPGIRPGRLTRPANLYQMAPTVLYLLGLPQDARMLRLAPPGGGVLEEAVDPELLAARPPRMLAEYPGTDRSLNTRDAGAQRAPIAEEELDRLRALGYVR